MRSDLAIRCERQADIVAHICNSSRPRRPPPLKDLSNPDYKRVNSKVTSDHCMSDLDSTEERVLSLERDVNAEPTRYVIQKCSLIFTNRPGFGELFTEMIK